MAPIKIEIKTRSGAKVLPDGIIVPDSVTVDELKSRFADLKPRYYPSRQRWTLPPKEGQRSGETLQGAKRLLDYNLGDGSVLIFKDLGPQIGYSTVFFWEYFGPLVLYPLFYLFPSVFYPWASTYQRPKATVQTLALMYWSFHYAKRIAETFFVHKFSHATMPVFNLIKNCAYYWSFGAYVAYFVNHPLYTPPPEQQTLVALAVAVLCQLANLRCHVILANLRTSGSGTGYVIPRGFLFNYITCPNYTAEILGWVAFTVATQTLPAAFFTLVGAGQMAVWAAGKHKRLRKMFDGREGREQYPRRRWIMMPPIY